MGIIIRTLYNNQDWQAPCKNPYKDAACRSCFDPNVAIRGPRPADEICSGNCWERNICVKYSWGCTPKGRTFGVRAYIGMKVFFVYKQLDGNYTLWGMSTVRSIDNTPLEEGGDDEKGFAFIHFNPFKALPRDKWVRDLTDRQLVGESWLMGRYRYIDARRESHLEQLIEGREAERPREDTVITSPANTLILEVQITPTINEKLDRIADEEGRQKDEIIREAIAEWLKGRES